MKVKKITIKIKKINKGKVLTKRVMDQLRVKIISKLNLNNF